MKCFFGIYFERPLKGLDLVALGEAFFRLTPELIIRTECGFVLDFSRCRRIHTPRGVEKRVQVILMRRLGRGVLPRTGWGRSLPEAWVKAKFQALDLVDSFTDWVDPLGLHTEFAASAQKIKKSLVTLGFHSLSELQNLPHGSAVARFGQTYEFFSQNYRNGEAFSWQRFRPEERFYERTEFQSDDLIYDFEPVFFELKKQIDFILKRAFGRGQALLGLELRIEVEKGIQKRILAFTLPVRFSFPQFESVPILRVLRERLSFKADPSKFEGPITALELEVNETASRERAQRDFFGLEKDIESENFSNLITILETKLKPKKEFFYASLGNSHRPEKSWVRSDDFKNGKLKKEEIPMNLPERPIRLFNPPEPLKRVGRYLIWNQERYAIQNYTQVERVSGEWWEEDEGFDRKYYRIMTEEGVEFWVFREKGVGVFLHGVF